MSLEATLSYRGPCAHDSELLEQLPGALRSLIEHHNGCIWLDGALHLRGACHSPAWHSLREAWQGDTPIASHSPEILATDIPFAQTTFGDQLLLRDHGVLRLRGSADGTRTTRILEPLRTSIGGLLAELERDPVRFLDLDPARRAPRTEWEDLLDFWFEDCGAAPERTAAMTARWFTSSEDFDNELRSRFLPLLERAEAGELDAWCATPRGTVAAVIVHDQLSRNLRRGSARAFALDQKALAIAKHAVATGVDQRVRPIEAVLLYLPFEHSESLEDQLTCGQLFLQLCDRSPREARASFEGFIEFANRHRLLIERFGRFPHRNRTLGRNPTTEERKFLEAGGDSF